MKGVHIMKENAIKAVLAAALGALASYGTQLIVPAIILVAVMVLDYITGVAPLAGGVD